MFSRRNTLFLRLTLLPWLTAAVYVGDSASLASKIVRGACKDVVWQLIMPKARLATSRPRSKSDRHYTALIAARDRKTSVRNKSPDVI